MEMDRSDRKAKRLHDNDDYFDDDNYLIPTVGTVFIAGKTV